MSFDQQQQDKSQLATNSTVTAQPKLGEVTVLGRPRKVVLSPNGKVAYVSVLTDTGGGAISVINTESLVKVLDIPLISEALELAISQDGRRIFALVSNGVAIIDTQLHLVEQTIGGDRLARLALSADETHLFVVKRSSDLVAIEISTGIERGFGTDGLAIAVSRQDGRVYVGTYAYNLDVYDGVSLALEESVPVNGKTDNLCLAPDGAQAYLAVPGGVTVVNTRPLGVAGNIALGLTGLVISTDGRKLYCVGTQDVVAVETSTRQIVGIVPIPGGPVMLTAGAALGPNNATLYVPDSNGRRVIVMAL